LNIIFSINSCFPLVLLKFIFDFDRLYKSSKDNSPFSNFLPFPESKLLYLLLIIFEYGDSFINLSAIINALAKVSAPPICAKNKSSGSVEFLLSFASKFTPPPCNPPDFKRLTLLQLSLEY